MLEKKMVIEGDALRADPGDVVLRIGREEELQLRLNKSKGRLDGLSAITVALKP